MFHFDKYIKNKFKQFGFSLIELLTVIAIIVILASLIFPSLNKSKQISKRISCESQLHQLTLGWIMYADDNNGKISFNKTDVLNFSVPQPESTTDSWVVGSIVLDESISGIVNGSLYPYIKNNRVYKCPSDMINIRSYSMNPGFNWFDDSSLREPLSEKYMIRTMNQIHKPDNTFVFIDENEQSINDGWFGVYIFLPSIHTWLDLPSTRHNQKMTTISYADGHVNEIKWKSDKIWVGHLQPVTGEDDIQDLITLQNKVIPTY